MSGDRGPSVSVPAAVAAAREFSDVRFTLIGRQPELERELGGAFPANVSCLFAADVVEMTDHPREALRRKKDSSMRRAIDLVKANDAHACVSAGNTGALMATAHFVLKMLPGVERPAIVSHHSFARRAHLHAGSRRQRVVHARAAVAVRGHGLGARGRSGGSARQAASGLAQYRHRRNQGQRHRAGGARICWPPGDINYVGFVEGDDIFSDKVDVVVTDGFTGNVALKAMEGAARLIGDALREEFSRSTPAQARLSRRTAGARCAAHADRSRAATMARAWSV